MLTDKSSRNTRKSVVHELLHFQDREPMIGFDRRFTGTSSEDTIQNVCHPEVGSIRVRKFSVFTYEMPHNLLDINGIVHEKLRHFIDDKTMISPHAGFKFQIIELFGYERTVLMRGKL